MRAVDLPATQYATTRDGVHIAYQVFGDGPADILYCGVHWWHLEFQWTEPHWRRFLERLGRIGRVILFDKRGTGLSDRVPTDELPTLEQRVDDLVDRPRRRRGASSAVAYGGTYGAQLAIALAALFPERVDALVVEDSMARLMRADDYPWGITPGAGRADARPHEQPLGLAGEPAARRAEPRATTPRCATGGRRCSASPPAPERRWTIMRTAMATDVRPLLAGVQCPDAGDAPRRQPADRGRPRPLPRRAPARRSAAWSCPAPTSSSSPATTSPT